MAFNQNAGHNGSVAHLQQQTPPHTPVSPQGTPPVMSWEELGSQRFQPRSKGRAILAFVSLLLLIAIIFAAVRYAAISSGTDEQLTIHVGEQQDATLDLRSSYPIDPQFRGVNVFPKAQSQSADGTFTGFMPYTQTMINDMKAMHISLLRYPGGQKGEDVVLSYQQLVDFAQMLNDTGAEGMLQAHLGGPVNGQPQDLTDRLDSRAKMAGTWVDFMNNKQSNSRLGKWQNSAFHPIYLWTVGNEPDNKAVINPETKQPYTVSEYVNAFIEFSKWMHQNSPRIKIYGPEISYFNGLGMGPFDAKGHAWMDEFIKGIANYEQQHQQELSNAHYNILDGISFHYYPFKDAANNPGQLMSSTNQWNYLLPQLRTYVKQTLGRDIPISVSEINANPGVKDGSSPTRGEGALWWADTLGTLMNQRVGSVGFFSAAGVDQPWPLFENNGQKATAMTRVLQVFAHMQKNVVPLNIQRDPIGVYATTDDSNQTVSIMFVNKSAITQSAQITPVNDMFGSSPWSQLNISLARNSIAVITLHRNGNAEAYNFLPPAQNDDQLSPVNFVTCGNKADALNNNIPC